MCLFSGFFIYAGSEENRVAEAKNKGGNEDEKIACAGMKSFFENNLETFDKIVKGKAE